MCVWVFENSLPIWAYIFIAALRTGFQLNITRWSNSVLVLNSFDADAIYVWFFFPCVAISTQITSLTPPFILPPIYRVGRPMIVRQVTKSSRQHQCSVLRPPTSYKDASIDQDWGDHPRHPGRGQPPCTLASHTQMKLPSPRWAAATFLFFISISVITSPLHVSCSFASISFT